MPRFSIETVFKGIDKMSKPIRKIESRINKFARGASLRLEKLNKKAAIFSKSFSTALGVAGLAGGLFLVQSVMADTITTGVQLEQTLVNAAAKFPGEIKKGTKEFKMLEDTARQVGKTTEFTASQAAEGLDFLAMAGFNAQQSVAALPAVVDLATAANVDLARATDIASDSLGAFNLMTDDAAKLSSNLARVNDVMAKTVTSANTNMELLFETIKEGGPVATSAGASIETFNALAGQLANAGIKGSSAGTTLKNVFLRLAAPVGGAANMLKSLGVETVDSQGNMRDIIDIIGDLEKSLKGLGTGEKAKVLNTIFGKIPLAGVNVLLSTGSDKLRDYRTALEDAGGAAGTMAAQMRDTLSGQIKTMNSAFEGLQITIFKLSETSLGIFITRLTEVIRTVDAAIASNDEFSKSVFNNIINVVIGAIGVFGELIIVVIALKIATIAFNTVIAISKGLVIAWKVALLVTKGVMLALTAGLWLAKAAIIAFNIAWNANPIGLIITAIVALIAVVVLLILNWRKVKDFFVKSWDFMVEKTKRSVQILKKLFDIVIKPFKTLSGGIVGIIKNVFSKEEGKEGEGAAGVPGVISPEERTANLIEQRSTTNQATLTVKDETGRTELEGDTGPGVNIKLAESGAF